jgi:hypothetical protein
VGFEAAVMITSNESRSMMGHASSLMTSQIGSFVWTTTRWGRPAPSNATALEEMVNVLFSLSHEMAVIASVMMSNKYFILFGF